MKKETYIKMTQLFREDAKQRAIHITNQIFTYTIFVAYPILLICLLLWQPILLAKAILVPLISFILLSVFRYVINRPRPYEKFQVPSVIEKDTVGKSFPSRHVFSAFVISMTFLCMLPLELPWLLIGLAMILISAGLGVIRVISGVHYISDVIAGAACGIFAGLIGYILL